MRVVFKLTCGLYVTHLRLIFNAKLSGFVIFPKLSFWFASIKQSVYVAIARHCASCLAHCTK